MVKRCPCDIMRCWKSHLQSREPLRVLVCPPVRQVGPLSPVVSRAAVGVPAAVSERQDGLVSRHRPHVLVQIFLPASDALPFLVLSPFQADYCRSDV